MAFADKRDLRSSKKIALVRLNPAKNVTSDLTLDSGTTYLFSMNDAVSRITLDGVEIDPNDWTQTGTSISVDLGITLTTETVVAEFYLFATSGQTSYEPEDPLIGGTEREWEPRITNPPKVTESNENITEGIVSVSASSFTLINTDRRYNEYIDTSVSFIDRSVKIWYRVEDETIQVFDGYLSTPFLQAQRIQITIKSALNPLKSAALMGDTLSETYATADGFPDIPTEGNKRLNYPIPMLLGRGSPSSDTAYIKENETIRSSPYYDTSDRSMLRAICIETDNPDAVNSFYRRWAVCRLPPGVNLYSEVVTVPSADLTNDASAARPTCTITNFPASMLSRLHVGDQLQVKDNTNTWLASGGRTGRILSIEGSTIVLDRQILQPYSDFDFRLPPVQIQYGEKFTEDSNDNVEYQQTHTGFPEFAAATRHFLIEETATSGGGKLIVVYFVPGAENALGFNGALPSNSPIIPSKNWIARVITDTDMTHADAAKLLVEKAGIETLDASYTAAGSALDSKVGVLIPSPSERIVKPYLQYLEKIVSPSFAYLRMEPDTGDNNIFKLGYHLIPDTVSTPDITITDNDILEDRLTVRFIQAEIITKIRAVNEAYEISDPDVSTVLGIGVPYLYNQEKELELQHYLLDTQKVQRILDFRSRPKRLYTFETKTKHLDAKLGDTVRIENDNLPGNRSFVDLFIIGLTKDLDKVQVKAIELGD